MSRTMKYFVLKPRGIDAYARASRMAMRAYHRAILDTDPELSEEVRQWTDAESAEAWAAAQELREEVIR